jgi:hypothetical protein
MRRTLLLSTSVLSLLSGSVYAQGPQSTPSVPTLAALKATPTTQFKTPVRRQGFLTPGDGGAATYNPSTSACTLNTGSGDDGSEVRGVNGKCYILVPDVNGVDLRVWGARPGFDATTQLRSAIAWTCRTHYPLWIHYDPALYAINSTINIGDGSVSAASTCNNVTIRSDSPMLESIDGLNPIFNWAGAADGTMFSINGPISTVTIENIGVNCLNLCSTGWKINNPIDSYFSRLGVRNYAGNATKAAYIITSVPANSILSGNEGSTYSLLGAWAPGTGASGMIVGESACAAGNCATGGAVIADKFDNLSIEHDCLTAGTWGIKLQFATQLTFDHTRIVGGDGQVCPGSPITNSVVIASPTGTGGTGYPTDITFLHPLFQMPVLDPGAGWVPAVGGINFHSFSTAHTVVPASVTPGGFWGTTSTGLYFGSTRQSFTPNVFGSTTAGTPVYTAQSASYDSSNSIYKIRFNVGLSSLTGSAGGLQIGLPKIAANRANDNGMCFISLHSGITFTAGYTYLTGYVAPNTSAINIMQNGSGQTFAAVPSSAAAGGATLFGFCEYPAQ